MPTMELTVAEYLHSQTRMHYFGIGWLCKLQSLLAWNGMNLALGDGLVPCFHEAVDLDFLVFPFVLCIWRLKPKGKRPNILVVFVSANVPQADFRTRRVLRSMCVLLCARTAYQVLPTVHQGRS